MKISKRQGLLLAATVSVLASAAAWAALRLDKSTSSTPAGIVGDSAPAILDSADHLIRRSSIEEVLQLAESALQHMTTTCDDYTARFVKQELDTKGILSEPTEIEIKTQTRMRNETNDAPRRVYLRFTKPRKHNGREVIWAEDLYDGKMVVHEAGLLGIMTLRLDPLGMIAMQGQRYPISNIGLVRLVEQLIERGERDRNNPNIEVTIKQNHSFDDVAAELIQIRRQEPDGAPEDFSLAEVIFDPRRLIILSYRSFGWPLQAGDPPPLQEFYAYHDLVINVGLSELDFDPSNPAYAFP